jgi:hypothetical protein
MVAATVVVVVVMVVAAVAVAVMVAWASHLLCPQQTCSDLPLLHDPVYTWCHSGASTHAVVPPADSGTSGCVQSTSWPIIKRT